jgi:hypothetical protein
MLAGFPGVPVRGPCVACRSSYHHRNQLLVFGRDVEVYSLINCNDLYSSLVVTGW